MNVEKMPLMNLNHFLELQKAQGRHERSLSLGIVIQTITQFEAISTTQSMRENSEDFSTTTDIAQRSNGFQSRSSHTVWISSGQRQPLTWDDIIECLLQASSNSALASAKTTVLASPEIQKIEPPKKSLGEYVEEAQRIVLKDNSSLVDLSGIKDKVR